MENWEQILELLKNFAIKHGPAAGSGIATLIVGWIVSRIARAVLKGTMRRAKVDPTLVGFVGNLMYMLLMTFVVIAALGRFGVQTGSFVAIIGAAGLAVGFALQGSLSNFAAGVMLIMFRPFRVGDVIEGGGVTGKVKEILIFSTIVNTPDNKRIVVPNSKLMGSNIVNFSAYDTRRVDLVAGIGYDDDIVKAKQVLEDILAKHPLILDDPAPAVAMIELADSSVNFNVRPWCRTADYWTVYSDVTESIKLEFDKQGISIPYPQRDVHLHTVGDAAA